MRSKLLIPIITLFVGALLFGTTYSAWIFDNSIDIADTAQVEVANNWTFEGPDYISIDNISNLSYLTAVTETTIVSPNSSTEAVRFINTAGTQTKDHSFIVAFDQEYTLRDIKTYKVEFDYYHAQKRQQKGKGFPKLQLMYNTSGRGNTHGGTETVNEHSPFIAYSINEDWWHLEYFVTSLCPTFADHGDTGINENTKINGAKIIDRGIYDYNGNTAFIVVDNFRFDNTLSPRLGLFNSGTSFSLTTGMHPAYYWMKICWAGTLNSCTMTFSDLTIAEQDTRPEAKSPFYIHGLQAGVVTVTATLDLGEQHQLLSISNEITITN